MKVISLTDWPVRIEGIVSLEPTPQGLICWRIPHDQRDLFHKNMHHNASSAAGVRISFISDTPAIELDVTMNGDFHTGPRFDGNFDLLIDDTFHQRRNFQELEPVGFEPGRRKTLRFDQLPQGEHRYEIYLPQQPITALVELRVDTHASLAPDRRRRTRWLTHGSSITHCGHAAGPTETWPALVARKFNLNHTNLGFGGQCHLDPMVARIIKERSVDVISLCFGINVIGSASLSPRTFREAAIGFIHTIRDGKPHRPIALISPIYAEPYETQRNAVGFTLPMMRDMLRETVELLAHHGDANLVYIDGLDIFGQADADLLSDGVHPTPEGYHRMAERFSEVAMPRLLAMHNA